MVVSLYNNDINKKTKQAKKKFLNVFLKQFFVLTRTEYYKLFLLLMEVVMNKKMYIECFNIDN